MRMIPIALLAAQIASPALAQHEGHSMPMPAPAPTPAPASEPEEQPTDPHAGHDMPAAEPDPHAGHDMSATEPEQPDPHAGHDMGAMPEVPAPPAGPPPAAAFSGPRHAAETVFGADDMLAARRQLRREHGGSVNYMVMADRLEARIRDGRDGYLWDGQGWWGGDIDKLWVKTEGEGGFGEAPEQAEVQALWSHAINPWFDVQAGVRYDFRPDPERAHLVLGVQGLAPYWIELDAAAFLSDEGDLTARIEAEYDQRITQKLILQPRVEFDLAAQDVPEIGLGSGLSSVEAGLRLRYQFVPEFAPYIGVEYERRLGDTADFARAADEDVGGWSFLAGIRLWF